ncbi:hypothetical protein AGMMS50229_03340 [Campylobacterota bacterium]|nr:hypothetical protein AGMMS50229_03340 [Campylobacterota bacterium]
MPYSDTMRELKITEIKSIVEKLVSEQNESYEALRKHNAIRPAREAFLIWIVMIAVSLASFVWIYLHAYETQRETIDTELGWLATIASSLIDGERHKQITNESQNDSDLYNSLVKPLVSFHRSMMDIYYVYTLIEKDGGMRFVLDTAKYVRDQRPTQALMHNRVMDRYDDPDPAIKTALRNGTMTVGALFEDELGTFKSAYAPIFDSRRNIIGVVGIDLSAETYIRRLSEVLHSCIYGMAISAAMATLISLVIYRMRFKARETAIETDTKRRESERLLAETNHENERLLSNIMPAGVIKRIKAGHTVIADSFERVSVAFIDLSGFTRFSASLTAIEVVDFLNRVFGKLDDLTVKYQLEKIKTIGDSYMVVGGLDGDSGHIERIADMLLETLVEFAKLKNETHRLNFDLRIGIDTGPAVAGVIGQMKFAYDIWGDTVNTASRMESLSIPGKIHCTDNFKRRLENSCLFEDRGRMEVKGKGEMRTYFLLGKVEEPIN